MGLQSQTQLSDFTSLHLTAYLLHFLFIASLPYCKVHSMKRGKFVSSTSKSLWRVEKKKCQLLSGVRFCNPMHCSLPGSSVHSCLQARIPEWVAIPFSRLSSWSRNWTWILCIAGTFSGSEVKASASNSGDQVRSLEKEMVTHSRILAWRIPWKEEPGRLQSTGSQRVRHNWTTSLSLSFPSEPPGKPDCSIRWKYLLPY